MGHTIIDLQQIYKTVCTLDTLSLLPNEQQKKWRSTCAVPCTVAYWDHLTKTEITGGKANDVFTTDVKIIALISYWQYLIITLRALHGHFCRLHVECLFQHLVSVLLNVNQTNIPNDRLQHFVYKTNPDVKISSKDFHY